jgi:hypothetical protein
MKFDTLYEPALALAKINLEQKIRHGSGYFSDEANSREWREAHFFS